MQEAIYPVLGLQHGANPDMTDCLQVNLTEDGVSTGRFTGSIETRMVNEPTFRTDPYVGVQEGDTLIVTFEDFNAAPGGIKVTKYLNLICIHDRS